MFTSGFFNSLNGDRRYDTEQISKMFDGIISDGVFANVGEQFAVVPGSGMNVIVKTGRAWFNHTWSLNDTWMTLTVDAPDPLRSRIDSVVLEVNHDPMVRANSIKIVKGEPASSPVPPTMVYTNEINQYRLANITVNKDTTTITTANVQSTVGMMECPFVTAPIQSVDVSVLFQQWDGQFQEWFENIKDQLSGDIAANLQKQVDERVKLEDKATLEDINNGTPGKWVDSQVAKNGLMNQLNSLKIGDIFYSARDLETETNGALIACDQRTISLNDYPELRNVDYINERIISPNRGKRVESGETNNNGRCKYYNGRIKNGYLYNLSTSDEATYTVQRIKLDETMKSVENLATITCEATMYSAVVYITDTYLYFLPCATHFKKWYRLNLLDKSLNEYNGTAVYGSAYNPNNYGAIMSSDGSLYVYATSVSSSNAPQQIYLWGYKYSKDFSTRTIFTMATLSYNVTTYLFNNPMGLTISRMGSKLLSSDGETLCTSGARCDYSTFIINNAVLLVYVKKAGATSFVQQTYGLSTINNKAQFLPKTYSVVTDKYIILVSYWQYGDKNLKYSTFYFTFIDKTTLEIVKNVERKDLTDEVTNVNGYNQILYFDGDRNSMFIKKENTIIEVSFDDDLTTNTIAVDDSRIAIKNNSPTILIYPSSVDFPAPVLYQKNVMNTYYDTYSYENFVPYWVSSVPHPSYSTLSILGNPFNKPVILGSSDDTINDIIDIDDYYAFYTNLSPATFYLVKKDLRVIPYISNAYIKVKELTS